MGASIANATPFPCTTLVPHSDPSVSKLQTNHFADMPNNKKKNKGKKGAKAARRDPSVFSCCHGSNDENFAGAYQNAIDDYFRRLQTFNGDEPSEVSKGFCEDNPELIKDPEFCQHLFAWCAREHIDKRTMGIRVILSLGFMMRYHYVPMHQGKDVSVGSKNSEKLARYNRDIYTKRGLIRALARETPCNCLDDDKAEAKKMEKLGHCYGCERQFPKNDLQKCSRCSHVQYCGRDCQKSHWYVWFWTKIGLVPVQNNSVSFLHSSFNFWLNANGSRWSFNLQLALSESFSLVQIKKTTHPKESACSISKV